MVELNLLQKIIIWGIPILFAITVHEVAHGWVANKLGDPTARMLGRLTLNPIKHIDLLGTIIIPGILLFLGGYIFGWAKPVPVTQRNLRKPRRDMALVALAGPLSNLLMAAIWALLLKLGVYLADDNFTAGIVLTLFGKAGVSINVLLAVLNLLPIPPLDGGKILLSILPGPIAYRLQGFETIGFFILLFLLSMGFLSAILNPIMQTITLFIYGLASGGW